MSRLAWRFLLLSVLVLAGQAVLGNQLEQAPLPWRDQIEECLQARPDVLLFGDSSCLFVNPEERDRRSLGEMFQSRFSDRRVAVMAYPAFHFEIYDALVCHLARQPVRPPVLVVPVNLRSFSLDWHARPEYQFRSQRLRLRLGDPVARTILRPGSVLGIYKLNPLTQEEYQDLPVFHGDRLLGRVGHFNRRDDARPHDEQLRDQFLFRYGYRLDESHPKLAAMRALDRRAREAGMKVRFYVTPVDYQAAERTAGPEWTVTVKQNLRALSSVSADFLDFSFLLESRHFDWGGVAPNEHLKEEGRRLLAERLAAGLGPR